MAIEIGTKQYRSVVVRVRPSKRLRGIAVLAALFAVCVAAAYYMGGIIVKDNYQKLQEEHRGTVEQLTGLELKYRQVSQKLTDSSLGAEIDRMSVEDVRVVVLEQKQKIADLNEEITFYKGLMAPTDRERGLSVRSWDVYESNDPLRFQFKLVVQQLAIKHLLLNGSVTVVLVGKQEGKSKNLSLHTLSEQVDKQNTLLRFKYFQYIEGELQLPVGFVPERVDIVARTTKPKAAQIEKQYSWFVSS